MRVPNLCPQCESWLFRVEPLATGGNVIVCHACRYELGRSDGSPPKGVEQWENPSLIKRFWPAGMQAILR